MNLMKRDNNIFRLLRIARDKTVKEIADELRVTPSYINAIENGSRIPSIRLIKDYAEALNVDERIIHEFNKNTTEKTRFEDMLLSLLNVIVK